MKCGHLFNGIGGFALAAHWMGWSNLMHCEIDPFCNQVMNHHFPNSHQHEDIRTTDFTIWRGRIDLLTGGFPCQPYSNAGKRKGKADNRHLWPEMCRAIREIQPGWIVGENVRGLTNWNAGLVFDEVQSDLEAEGYEVLPFLLPAAGVNAPHKRDRIWFVAYRPNAGAESLRREGQNEIYESGIIADSECIRERKQANEVDSFTESRKTRFESGVTCGGRSVTNSYSEQRREGRLYTAESEEAERYAGTCDPRYARGSWKDFPTQSPICNRNDGISGGLANIAVPSKKFGTRILTGKQAYGRWRKESLKALGNAIVPHVAFQLFKAIDQYTTP